MMDNIEIQILVKIKKAKRGSLFFIEYFLRFGNSKAISKALERLVEKGEISRIGHLYPNGKGFNSGGNGSLLNEFRILNFS